MELLTSNSPRYNQTHGYVQLMPHQEALLYHCMKIEQLGDVGVLADSPGSGKTYVVLSLIMMDINSVNVIVVPQNIYTQWDEAIKVFCGEQITYSKFITYSDVSALYFKPSMLNANIILTTPLYYNIIIDALHKTKKISRVFVDEIDSVVSLINNKNRICDMIWFVSASVTATTLKRMGFDLQMFDRISCKCQEEFIKQSFNIPEPEYHTIICQNVLIDHILHGMITELEYNRLNAMDYNGINKLNNVMIANNEKEAVDYFIKDLLDTEQQLTVSISDLEKQLNNVFVNPNDRDKVIISLNEKKKILIDTSGKIKCLKERLEECNICNICYCDIELKVIAVCCQNSYCDKCLTFWVNKSSNKSCPTCRKPNVEVISMSHVEESMNSTETDSEQADDIEETHHQKTKIDELNDLLKYNLGEKIIIFADYTSIFKEIAKLLEKENIKYVELDGGNIASIDKDINEYKNGQARVLMTNSSLYGCGMNLQNTSDIVLLHKTNVTMKEQVIGRAQRPGRTSQLKVWELLHGNENETDS